MDNAVLRRRFTQEQIGSYLGRVARAVKNGQTIAESCAELGVSETTYYRWRARAASSAKRNPASAKLESRDRILLIAKELFLREGRAVGLDAVARSANVTRQTLYNLFGNRERLFRLVVNTIYSRVLDPILHVDPKGDLRTTLLEYGRQVMAVALDPEAIAMFRLTVTESSDFPDLGRILYATTSLPTPVLAAHLQTQIDAGRLRNFDTTFGAEAFVGAIISHPRYRALLGVEVESQERREARLQMVVDLFIQSYSMPQTDCHKQID